MNLNSNPALVRFVRNVLIIILVAKALSLVMLWYFQHEGVHYHANSSKIPEYKRYNAKNLIHSASKPDAQSAIPEPTSEEAKELAAYGPNISNMTLKGLFRDKQTGFIIIALKAKPKDSEVIGINESFKGYKLTRILQNGAVFDKNGAPYTLYFSKKNKDVSYVKRRKSKTQQDDGGIKQVRKSDIVRYAKNVKQIWKDIGIVEVKKKKKTVGFKVTRIKANTPFAQLGLRKGDIIIKANNKPMKSYKDAIAIYKNIDKLEALELIVLRNNQETEISYEIN